MTEKKEVKRSLILTPEQDQKIRQIQIRRMTAEKKTISYSSILKSAIDEGLERLQ